MCFSITWTNAKDVNNNIGKKYVTICELNDPIVSRLVQYLNAIMQARRARILAKANPLYDLPKAIDHMPTTLVHFPHNWEKKSGVFFPIFASTQTMRSWQAFSGFLAALNDAGFPRKALYELLRNHAEDHDVSAALTADDKSSFTTFANKMSARDFARNRGLPLRDRAKWKVWQLAYQPWSGVQPVTVNGISYPVRFIDCTEVDWCMERGSIIVPRDWQTAIVLLYLKKMELWNFARNLNEIKSTNECWQNILMVS
jgi:hypothetical protein